MLVLFGESSQWSLAKAVGLIRHVEPGVTVAPAGQLGREDGKPRATRLSNHKTLLTSSFLSIVLSVWMHVKLKFVGNTVVCWIHRPT